MPGGLLGNGNTHAIKKVMVIYKQDDLFNAVVVSLDLFGVVIQIPDSAFNLKEVTIMTTLKW